MPFREWVFDADMGNTEQSSRDVAQRGVTPIRRTNLPPGPLPHVILPDLVDPTRNDSSDPQCEIYISDTTPDEGKLEVHIDPAHAADTKISYRTGNGPVVQDIPGVSTPGQVVEYTIGRGQKCDIIDIMVQQRSVGGLRRWKLRSSIIYTNNP